MQKCVLVTLRGLFLSLALLSASAAFADNRFPQGPNIQMTPGDLCHTPSAYRYPEHVPYCNRKVDTSMKKDIIEAYDKQFGFQIGQMDRQQFKIDHYIPLCMGGSNERENLWPQHESVYTITDPLEPLLCEKMQAGVLLQAKAVELVKEGKNDLTKVSEIISYLNSL